MAGGVLGRLNVASDTRRTVARARISGRCGWPGARSAASAGSRSRL